MTEPPFIDKDYEEVQTRKNVSPVILSLVIALALGLAAGYYVHIKNQRLTSSPPNKTINTANHAN